MQHAGLTAMLQSGTCEIYANTYRRVKVFPSLTDEEVSKGALYLNLHTKSSSKPCEGRHRQGQVLGLMACIGRSCHQNLRWLQVSWPSTPQLIIPNDTEPIMLLECAFMAVQHHRELTAAAECGMCRWFAADHSNVFFSG